MDNLAISESHSPCLYVLLSAKITYQYFDLKECFDFK